MILEPSFEVESDWSKPTRIGLSREAETGGLIADRGTGALQPPGALALRAP
jgi:hypothetical protein